MRALANWLTERALSLHIRLLELLFPSATAETPESDEARRRAEAAEHTETLDRLRRDLGK